MIFKIPSSLEIIVNFWQNS